MICRNDKEKRSPMSGGCRTDGGAVLLKMARAYWTRETSNIRNDGEREETGERDEGQCPRERG